jgi:hypothetical protein
MSSSIENNHDMQNIQIIEESRKNIPYGRNYFNKFNVVDSPIFREWMNARSSDVHTEIRTRLLYSMVKIRDDIERRENPHNNHQEFKKLERRIIHLESSQLRLPDFEKLKFWKYEHSSEINFAIFIIAMIWLSFYLGGVSTRSHYMKLNTNKIV